MPISPQTSPPKNLLADSPSHYLRQHANNPVHWRPWGPEAIEEARARAVPIFLSIGYSTCYWCHVMERESFEDPQIASLINQWFVPVKIDREQHPAVDQFYMAAVQALTGRGGWPLNVFLTPPGTRSPDDPGLEAFWGGTYFPPRPHQDLLAFSDVLQGMNNAWETRREDILEQAQSLRIRINQLLLDRASPVQIGPRHVQGTADTLFRLLDQTNGGFSNAPKFPQAPFLQYLLEIYPYASDSRTNERTTRALTLTLDSIARGGIHDHIAGGFHRYSVDAQWRIPHFEKLLTDQALLASTYAWASQRLENPHYASVAQKTCDFVLTHMRRSDNLFASALDAEVNHHEGENYLWTPEQMSETLTEDELALATKLYNLDAGPNFQDPHDQSLTPSNVLYLADSIENIAAGLDLTAEQLSEQKSAIDAKLLDARSRRPQPYYDDKAIASWNALMIAALADTARLTGEPRYLDEAIVSARAWADAFVREDDQLLRVKYDDDVSTPATLEDHAYAVHAYLAIHKALPNTSPDAIWALDNAVSISSITERQFSDSDSAGYFDTAMGQSLLPIRTRNVDDGALPAPASIMAHNLLDLYKITGNQAYYTRAGKLMESLSQAVAQRPVNAVTATRALIRLMADHPSMFQDFSLGPQAPTLEEFEATAGTERPVRIYSSDSRIEIDTSDPTTFAIRVEIQPDYHVVAHEPGNETFHPFSIDIEDVVGLEAIVSYPEPELYEGVAVDPNSPDRLMVYTGTLELEIALNPTGLVAGDPKLVISYQVCSDTECLPAQTGRVDVELTIKQ
ncbi:MAG: DUF255 domain-containing protein [Planctomycetota bacterium]|jgi:uncharacterized protein YyaL (SSP411 family)